MNLLRITYEDKNGEERIGCFIETDSGYWSVSISEKYSLRKIIKKEEVYVLKGELKFMEIK